MPKAPITDEVALRIALAARALPDTDPARLIRVLDDAVGLPPTAQKLATLKVKDFRAALDGEFSEVDTATLKAAVAILKGESDTEIDPPSALEPYAEGDMPGSIRVACASNAGEALDGHFGSARRFLIYQVCADDSDAEDKNAYRAELIRDCQVLYVASIGGPAAATVVKAEIHPIKEAAGGSARDSMAALQAVLAAKPPPWLAKVMGQTPEERIRFERDEEVEA